MTEYKLKSCPFCGSRDLELDNLADPAWGWYVSCRGCEIQQIANYSQEQAVERWNKDVVRTQPICIPTASE